MTAADAAVADQAEGAGAVVKYACAICHGFIASSPLASGHATMKCPNRRCGQWQTVAFGKHPRYAERESPRSLDSADRPRVS